jgi:hypothetical protein
MSTAHLHGDAARLARTAVSCPEGETTGFDIITIDGEEHAAADVAIA